MSIMENYNKALKELYDHVGFVEDWVVCPIDDCTEMYWSCNNKIVRYAESEEQFHSYGDSYYENDIYTQRFYDKWVYRGEKYTMIFCDPRTDGVKWFRIFDNEKEI